jgi:DNA-binding transcriptional ArsR family regulator
MAQNKKEEFSDKFNKISDFAKALSHPARIAILKKLANENKCICGEIVEIMPLSQSTVSQHLKELKISGLIQGEIEGVASKYCINWKNLDKALNELSDFLNDIKKKNIEVSHGGCCS